MGKTYKVNWQGGVMTSVEVDGVVYESPDEIPNPDDRAEIEALIAGELQEADAPPSSDPLTRIVLSVLIGSGVLVLVIAAVLGVNTRRRLAKEVPADGQVVEMVERRDDAGRDYHYPVVEFTLPNGDVKRVQLPEGSWPPAYEVGEAVTVRYDPAKPIDARIESGTSTLYAWTWSIILGILGAMVLAITLFVGFVFRVTRKPVDP